MPGSAPDDRWTPGRNYKTFSEQPINRSAAGSDFGRGKLWGEGERRQAKDLPAGKFPAAKKIAGGLFFNQEKAILTRILVSVIVRGRFFHRHRKASAGVHIQGMQGG
jgi:hypothetical protein